VIQIEQRAGWIAKRVWSFENEKTFLLLQRFEPRIAQPPWWLLLTKLWNLRVFVGRPEGKRRVGGRRHIWQDDIKVNLKKGGLGGMD
jgi:hypothetical protein